MGVAIVVVVHVLAKLQTENVVMAIVVPAIRVVTEILVD